MARRGRTVSCSVIGSQPSGDPHAPQPSSFHDCHRAFALAQLGLAANAQAVEICVGGGSGWVARVEIQQQGRGSSNWIRVDSRSVSLGQNFRTNISDSLGGARVLVEGLEFTGGYRDVFSIEVKQQPGFKVSMTGTAFNMGCSRQEGAYRR